jgi:hypothetical protein
LNACAISTCKGSDISVLLGNGIGGFTAAPGSPGPTGGSGGAVTLAVGDFNNDGFADLAIGTLGGAAPLVISLGNGQGTFNMKSTPEIGGSWIPSIGVGDFNGDGKLDLAVAGRRSPFGPLSGCPVCPGFVQILLGNGDGTFQVSNVVELLVGPRSVAVGDFNGDGKLDLVSQ